MFFPLPPLMVLSLRFYQRVMSTSPSVSFSSRPSPGFSSSHLLKGFQGQRTECGPAVGQPSGQLSTSGQQTLFHLPRPAVVHLSWASSARLCALVEALALGLSLPEQRAREAQTLAWKKSPLACHTVLPAAFRESEHPRHRPTCWRQPRGVLRIKF